MNLNSKLTRIKIKVIVSVTKNLDTSRVGIRIQWPLVLTKAIVVEFIEFYTYVV